MSESQAQSIIPGEPAHVLLIGVDAYPGAPLGGSVHDIDALQRLLVDRLGVERTRIERLASPHPGAQHETDVPSRPATLANIREAFARLASEAVKPGESVFVHYSGHGTQVAVAGAAGARFFREALVPVDVAAPGGAQLLFDFELNRLLQRVAARTPQVTVVLDCCSSAGVTRDALTPPGASDRFMRIAAPCGVEEPGAPTSAARGITQALVRGLGDCQVIAACLSDERARELDDGAGRRHGALTSALLARLGLLAPDALARVCWGDIWRGVLVEVAAKSPAQHPWLCGDFARRVFDRGSGAGGAMGFSIARYGERYRIDGGALFGVTSGARLRVAAPTPGAQEAALVGRVRVCTASAFAAEATAEGAAFDVPFDARAEVEAPGAEAQLPVALEGVAPDVAALVRAEPSARVVGANEAEVWLTEEADGSLVLSDDAHAARSDTDEPLLAVVPVNKRALVPALLAHAARYRAPLRLARACTDLPGKLAIDLLDCNDAVALAAADPQDPALPEAASTAGAYPYRLRPGDAFCVRVTNRSRFKLFVTLLNAAASGCVEYLGDATVGGAGTHVFWLDGNLGIPFEASITTGRPLGLDRLVAIGTTAAGTSLRFLSSERRFRDLLERSREATREGAVVRAPPVLWTSAVTALLIDARDTGAARGSSGAEG